MATFFQMQRLVELEPEGWFSVGLPESAWPLGEQPVGGVATVMNRAGDVAKVFGDGRVVAMRANGWANGHGPEELCPPVVPGGEELATAATAGPARTMGTPASKAPRATLPTSRYILLFRGGRRLTEQDMERVRTMRTMRVLGHSPTSSTFQVDLLTGEDAARQELDGLSDEALGPWVLSPMRVYSLAQPTHGLGG